MVVGARVSIGPPQMLPAGRARQKVQQQLVLAQHPLLAVVDQGVEDAVAREKLARVLLHPQP